MKKIVYFLIFILLISFAYSEISTSTLNFLTKNRADTLYCALNAPTCIFLGNITFAGDVAIIGDVLNITVHNLIVNATTIVGLNESIGELGNDTYLRLDTANDPLTGDLIGLNFNGSWNGSIDYNTSDEISGAYVPYIGATDNVDLGVYDLDVDDMNVGDDLEVTGDTDLLHILNVYGISHFYDDFYVDDDANFNTSISLYRANDSILEVETTSTGGTAQIRVLADGTNDLYIYTYGSTAEGNYYGFPRAGSSYVDAQGERLIIGTFDTSPLYLATSQDPRFIVTKDGDLIPFDDDNYIFGNKSNRVADIYVVGESSQGIHFVQDDESYGNLSMDADYNLLWNGKLINITAIGSEWNGSVNYYTIAEVNALVLKNITNLNESVKLWVYNGTLAFNDTFKDFPTKTNLATNISGLNESVKLWVYNGTLAYNSSFDNYIRKTGETGITGTYCNADNSICLDFDNGNITVQNISGNNADFTGTLGAGAITGTSLDAGAGLITTTGTMSIVNGAASSVFNIGAAGSQLKVYKAVNAVFAVDSGSITFQNLADAITYFQINPKAGQRGVLRIDSVNIFDFDNSNSYCDTLPGGAYDFDFFRTSTTGRTASLYVYGYPTGLSNQYGRMRMVNLGGANAFEISSNSKRISFNDSAILTTSTNNQMEALDIGGGFGDTGISLYENGSADFDGDLNAGGNITAENVFLLADISAHTNVTMPVISAGEWVNVTFDEEASTPVKDITHVHSDGTNDTFTIVHPGTYELRYTVTVADSNPTPGTHIVVRLIKNDVEIEGSLLEEDSTRQYAEFTIGNGPHFDLVEGDKIKLQFTASGTTVSMESHQTYGEHKDSATMKIKRIR